jgi:hypothetical protein
MATEVRRIPLDRRVCVVREGRIDVRPERAALVGPLVGLAISIGLYVSVGVFRGDLSFLALTAMLVPGLILGPLSAMALVYSLLGASVIVDAEKRSVAFRQGVLGLGLGMAELVPFSEIERLEVQDLPLGEEETRRTPLPLDLRAWDVVLVKTSGEQLSIGQVIAVNNPDLIDEGFDRAVDVAEAIGTLAGKQAVITAAVEEPAAGQAGASAFEPAGEPVPPGSEAEGRQQA